ncbi:MAG: HD-GYP domain-containing protein [Thermotogota bacterium]
MFFLPFHLKNRESYIILSNKSIFISIALKGYINTKEILDNPTKNGIIKVISKNRKEIKNIVDIIKIKDVKRVNRISDVKKIYHKKKQNNSLFSSMIFSFAKMSEMGFPKIDYHLKLFRVLSKIIIEKMEENQLLRSKPKYFSKYFVIFSVLHDIGKISIPNRLLYSNNHLSEDEYEIYKTHINFGIHMIEDLSNHWNLKDKKILDIAKNLIKDHHENYDGSGYPNSLKSEQISIEGRITAIIDNYLKYLTKEKNKEAAHKNAINCLVQNKSKKFDPEIVDIFISLEDEIYKNISSI